QHQTENSPDQVVKMAAASELEVFEAPIFDRTDHQECQCQGHDQNQQGLHLRPHSDDMMVKHDQCGDHAGCGWNRKTGKMFAFSVCCHDIVPRESQRTTGDECEHDRRA